MSTPRRWLRLGANPWANGVRLAALNGLLAGVCIAVFGGALAVVVALARTGFLLPFPFPLLVVVYAGLYVVLWGAFAARLPAAPRRRRLLTGLVGATPLFGLGLLGYADAAWQWTFGDFLNNSMLEAGIFLLTLISTLVLVGGAVCVALLTLLGREEVAEG